MKKIKDVSYSEVIDFFEKEHPVDDKSIHFSGNKWAMKHLEWANEVSEGVWSLCELDSSEILDIVFSHHAAEGTDNVLVDENGLTLADTAKKISKTKDEYAANNPECWAKMQYWAGKDFSPLLLSTQPTMEGKGRRSLVNPDLGSLFHQDGLHRLVRWTLDGRFDEAEYSQGAKLTAYIAGKL